MAMDVDPLTDLYQRALTAEHNTASIQLSSGHTIYLSVNGTAQGRSTNMRKHYRKEWNIKYPGEQYSKRASEETVRNLVKGQ
jgi:hypothetical protein